MRTCRVCAKVGPDDLFVKNGKFRKNTCKRCDADRVLAYQKTHSEHNLQVIPASVNLRKRNLYWPDMPAGITPLRRYDDV